MIEITKKDLVFLLKRVAYATRQVVETHPNTEDRLYIEQTQTGMILACTDGYRVARVKCPIPTATKDKKPFKTSLSLSILTIVLNELGEGDVIEISEDEIKGIHTYSPRGSRGKAAKYSVHLELPEFPDLDVVMPRCFDLEIAIPKKVLSLELTRIKQAMKEQKSPERPRTITFIFDPEKGGKVGLYSSQIEKPVVLFDHDIISGEYTKYTKIGFNLNYFDQAVRKSCFDTVVLGVNGPLDPLILNSETEVNDSTLLTTCVVMPMRI